MKFGLLISVVAVLWINSALAVDVESQDASASCEKEIDRVIAAIEGEPLTMGDLRRFISSLSGEESVDIHSDPRATRKYLNELISSRLFEKEAESMGVAVTDDEIDTYVEEVKRQNSFDDEAFKALLTERGLTLEDYRRQVRGDISKTRIMQSLVKSSVNICDEDVDRFLTQHPERIPGEGEVHLYQLMVELPGGMPEETERGLVEKLDAIRVQLNARDDWARVEGASFVDIGYVDTAELREELQSAVMDLEVNKVSPVIQTDGALYVVMVLARGGSDWSADSQFRESIKRELYEAKVRERMDKFVSDELPSKYHVEMLLKLSKK